MQILGLLAKSKGVIICQSWPLWLLLLPHSAMMLHLCQKAPFHCTGVQDEKNQLLTTCMWFNLVWTDYQLSWNSSEYGDVDSVVIQPRNRAVNEPS